MDRQLIRWILMLLIGWQASPLTAGQSVPPLILQLGDAEFDRRVSAERELLDLGSAGLELLESGVRSSDPEIRQRSIRLLELLRKVAFVEQRNRVREDPWTVDESLAPGWEFYQLLVGDSLAARDLYVRMIDQESDLMLAVMLRPDRWQEDFERRCADLRTFVDRRSNRDLDPVGVLALLFLADHPDNRINPISAQCISNLISHPEFFNFVQKAPTADGAVCRALLSDWILHSGNSTAVTRLGLATKYQLPAGLAAAQEIIANRNAVGASRTQLQNAIRFLSTYGGPDAVLVLEPLLLTSHVDPPLLDDDVANLLENPPQAATPPAQVDLLMNDLALLGLVLLTNQDLQQYGFANIRLDLDHRFNANSPNFSNEDERRRALLRWQAWRLAHPLKLQPGPRDASEGWQL